jgi:short-subunit dehydrogenase
MSKNILIIGMGAGLSMGVAKRFAAEGFGIGMISRNADKLKKYQDEFQEQAIPAYYRAVDVADTDALLKAIDELKKEMDGIYVLNYNAVDARYVHLMDEKVDDLVKGFRISVGNAFAAVRHLRDELKKYKGAVLLTGGGTAITPMHEFATISLGKAGIRNLAFQLNDALKKDGIYVGTLTVNGAIDPKSAKHNPTVLAQKFWDMYRKREKVEVIH